MKTVLTAFLIILFYNIINAQNSFRTKTLVDVVEGNKYTSHQIFAQEVDLCDLRRNESQSCRRCFLIVFQPAIEG